MNESLDELITSRLSIRFLQEGRKGYGLGNREERGHTALPTG